MPEKTDHKEATILGGALEFYTGLIAVAAGLESSMGGSTMAAGLLAAGGLALVIDGGKRLLDGLRYGATPAD